MWRNCSMSKHTLIRTSTAYMKLKTIKQFKDLLLSNVKWNLVETNIDKLSQINCVDIAYNLHLIQKLSQKIQNVRRRYVFLCIARCNSMSHLHKSLNNLNIYEMQRMHFLVFVHKLLLCKKPNHLYNSLSTRAKNNIRNTTLQNANNLVTPTHKTNLKKASYIKPLGNIMCCHVISRNSVQSFKTIVRELVCD